MAKIGIKRAYAAAEKSDGQRVLVDGLWPRGLTHEALDLTLWLKDIAPSTDLRLRFHHDPAARSGFRQRY